MTARVSAEKLRQRNQEDGAGNEALKAESSTQKKKLLELEFEVKKLSGQQNLPQTIHHHARVKGLSLEFLDGLAYSRNFLEVTKSYRLPYSERLEFVLS